MTEYPQPPLAPHGSEPSRDPVGRRFQPGTTSEAAPRRLGQPGTHCRVCAPRRCHRQTMPMTALTTTRNKTPKKRLPRQSAAAKSSDVKIVAAAPAWPLQIAGRRLRPRRGAMVRHARRDQFTPGAPACRRVGAPRAQRAASVGTRSRAISRLAPSPTSYSADAPSARRGCRFHERCPSDCDCKQHGLPRGGAWSVRRRAGKVLGWRRATRGARHGAALTPPPPPPAARPPPSTPHKVGDDAPRDLRRRVRRRGCHRRRTCCCAVRVNLL